MTSAVESGSMIASSRARRRTDVAFDRRAGLAHWGGCQGLERIGAGGRGSERGGYLVFPPHGVAQAPLTARPAAPDGQRCGLYQFRVKAYGPRYQTGSPSSSRWRIGALARPHGEKQTQCRRKGPDCASCGDDQRQLADQHVCCRCANARSR